MTLNNFVFNCKKLVTDKSLCHGPICAPAYDNVFLDLLKENIYPFLGGLLLSYLRFIDDIFFISTGSKDQLITFLNDLNTKHNSIKFEYKISQSNIFNLDTEVYVKINKLYTKIGRKETERQNFLHISSEHPISLKNSIPHSQVLRAKHTCSTIENFKLYCSELKQKFIEKGHKSDLLDKHISTVQKLDRNEMLKKKVREKPKQACIPLPLTLTYNLFCPNISKVIRKQ